MLQTLSNLCINTICKSKQYAEIFSDEDFNNNSLPRIPKHLNIIIFKKYVDNATYRQLIDDRHLNPNLFDLIITYYPSYIHELIFKFKMVNMFDELFSYNFDDIIRLVLYYCRVIDVMPSLNNIINQQKYDRRQNLIEFFDDYNLSSVIKFTSRPESYIRTHFDKLNKRDLCRYDTIPFDLIEQHLNEFNMNDLSFQNLPRHFIWKHRESLNIDRVFKFSTDIPIELIYIYFNITMYNIMDYPNALHEIIGKCKSM